MMILVRIIDSVVFLYVILIAIRVLMMWFRPEVIYAYKKFFDIVARLVDPLLALVRRLFPANIGRMDLSPVIAVVLVETVKFIILYFIRLLMSGKPA